MCKLILILCRKSIESSAHDKSSRGFANCEMLIGARCTSLISLPSFKIKLANKRSLKCFKYFLVGCFNSKADRAGPPVSF
jgi:hypothetical protein